MIKNFLFHRVNPKKDILWEPMDVALFEKCIQYITKKYNVVLIEDIVFSDELFSGNNYATIMFDDGFIDNIDYAAPILDKYKCKASFYVVTDCIEKNIPTWTYILEHSFQFTKLSDINLEFDFLPEDMRVSKLSTNTERLNYVSRLKPFLKKLSHENRTFVLNHVAKYYNDVEMPLLMMNWRDLSELKSAGHYIGSHTATHGMLGTMSNKDEIKNELLSSGNAIKKNSGYFPLTISYPVGSFNDTVKKISAEVGYKLGLAVKQKIFNPVNADLFEIPRIELYNEPWWKTRLRITNTLENIKSIIRYK